jgi:hypothetical protein
MRSGIRTFSVVAILLLTLTRLGSLLPAEAKRETPHLKERSRKLTRTHKMIVFILIWTNLFCHRRSP